MKYITKKERGSLIVPVCLGRMIVKLKNSMALVRERTIPTERPPPVGEVSASEIPTQNNSKCLNTK
jgi:hypothetical protein